MSWRSYEEGLPSYVPFYRTWGNKPGMGKYWKTQLHKARRRYWKELIEREFWHNTEVHPRDPSYYESMVSMRAW